MAHEIKIANGIICITFTGTITSLDLDQIGDKAERLESELTPTPDRMTDLTSCESIDLDYKKMVPFASRRSEAPLKNDVKSALIASKPVHYGFAHMFSTLNTNPKITIQVFSDVKDALKWLGL